jgi:hypothetical protein
MTVYYKICGFKIRATAKPTNVLQESALLKLKEMQKTASSIPWKLAVIYKSFLFSVDCH